MFVPDPWHAQTPDDVQRPPSIQVNVHIPSDASQADGAALMRTAQDIVNHYQTDLHRWIGASRRDISIGGPRVARSRLDFPELQSEWQYNQGQERIALNIYPAGGSNSSVSTDTNLDGYICWIHGDPGYPDLVNFKSATPGPYNLFLNGYLIEQDYQPIGPVGGYPILFGKTALLCASYVGDIEKANPLINSKNFKLPNIVVPPNGWGNYDAGTAPDGSLQGKISKTLGYWLFDWTNIHNPCQFISFSFGGAAQQWTTAFTGDAVKPQFDKGMYFKTAAKSPLVSSGKNGFSAALSPASPGSEEVEIIEAFIGEFYNRGKYRIVSQSWTYPTKARRSIQANDSPLIYGAVSLTGGFSPGGGMRFDLTPKYTSEPPTGDDSLLGPHMAAQYGSGSEYTAGLNDDELSTFHAWEDAVKAKVAAYQASIATQLAALTAQIAAAYLNWVRAYKMAIVYRALTANPKAFETFFPDYSQLYLDNAGQPILFPHTPAVDPPPTSLVTKVVKTTYPNPSGGTITYTSDIEYGPQQLFVLDLSQDLFVYQDDPAGGHTYPYYITVPGSAYDNVVGTYPNTVETSGQEFEAATYPFTTGPDFLEGSYAQIEAAIAAYVPTAVNTYNALIKQQTTLINSTPPDAPPMPKLGDSFEKFDYSNITISGNDWRYEQ